MIQKKGLSDFSKTEKRVCDTLHFHKPFFLQCNINALIQIHFTNLKSNQKMNQCYQDITIFLFLSKYF